MSVPIDETLAAIGTLRDTMLSFSAITDIVGNEIHVEDVEDTLELPYVIMVHIAGGYENSTQADAVDTYWKVVMYTADKQQAIDMRAAMANLHRAELVTVNEPNVTPYATVRQTLPIFERDDKQGVSIYAVGGIYRLRFIINPIIE